MAYVGQGIKGGTFSVLDTSGNTYNGSNTTFNLGTHVSSPAQLLVSHDGVIQKPVTDYTLATGGTQITFTTAPASGASIFITEISGAVGAPMNRDINGDELILDADADTSITADTDDQIDIRVGGSDIATLTSSALTLKNSATADNSTFTVNLQTAEADIAADDVLAKINFQAPNEGTGTDANLIAASIQATSEGNFAADNNATKLEFMTGASEAATTKMSISSGGIVGIGATLPGDLGAGLHIKTADSGASVSTDADELVLENSGGVGMTMLGGTSSDLAINFGDSGDNDIGRFIYANNGNKFIFHANGADRAYLEAHTDGNGGMLKLGTGGNSGMLTTSGGQMQIQVPGSEEIQIKTTDSETLRAKFLSAGGFLVSTTTTDGNSLTGGGDFGAIINAQSGKTPGFAFQGDGMVINRSDGDNNSRDCIMFYRNGSNAGNISASNSTVSYGTFMGVHYAQLTDDSKPNLLVGTVMESINETSEWHMAQFTVPEHVDEGITVPAQVKKRYIPKTNSVGDNIKFKWHKNYKEGEEGFNDNAVEYDAVVVKENDEEYLARVKVSTTENSKAVYGVFESWMESEANDMQVASLGAFMIRVHKDETVSIGDYLQSKGDGTAKVQADDILRASTVAKVVKTNKIKTYADGSYLVSCTLHCG
jgi:hypothetical protein